MNVIVVLQKIIYVLIRFDYRAGPQETREQRVLEKFRLLHEIFYPL